MIINHCRYFAVVVIVGVMDADDVDSFNTANAGPYNEEAANEANSNQQAYSYIAGIVSTDDINYPYSYILGDESITSNGQVNYINVPLQPGTEYYVLVRAHTLDEKVRNYGS